MKKLRTFIADVLRRLAYELDPGTVEDLKRGLAELQRQFKAGHAEHTDQAEALAGQVDRLRDMILGTKAEPVVQPGPQEPVAGERYFLCPKKDGDPFPPSEMYVPVVKVLEVKHGWVRYWIGSDFPDNRLTISMFLHCYRKVVQLDQKER